MKIEDIVDENIKVLLQFENNSNKCYFNFQMTLTHWKLYNFFSINILFYQNIVKAY